MWLVTFGAQSLCSTVSVWNSNQDICLRFLYKSEYLCHSTGAVFYLNPQITLHLDCFAWCQAGWQLRTFQSATSQEPFFFNEPWHTANGGGTRSCSCLRHCDTSRKIADSFPFVAIRIHWQSFRQHYEPGVDSFIRLVTMGAAPFVFRRRHVLEETLPCPVISKTIVGKWEWGNDCIIYTSYLSLKIIFGKMNDRVSRWTETLKCDAT